MSDVFNGQILKQATLDQAFLTSPGEDLVAKTLLQMSKIPAFVALFGPYKSDSSGNKNSDQQRWADYPRHDWSIRQLPSLNVFENQVEDKESDQAFLNGTVTFQVFWPPKMSRSDLARVPATFKGIMENFFASDYVFTMLDELYYIQRPEKVYGLNAYGRQLNWTPSAEGIVEDELVPVTILDVRYRIDLRSWYRALEFMDRSKGQPFIQTLSDLNTIGGEYDGVTDKEGQDVEVVIEEEIKVTNP